MSTVFRGKTINYGRNRYETKHLKFYVVKTENKLFLDIKVNANSELIKEFKTYKEAANFIYKEGKLK